MRLSLFFVVAFLSFSATHCLTKGSSRRFKNKSGPKSCCPEAVVVKQLFKGLCRFVGKLKTLPGKKGRSRRTRISATAPSNKTPPQETVRDKKRFVGPVKNYEEFEEKILLPYFTQDTEDDFIFRRTLEKAMKQRAKFKAKQGENEAESKEFLEKCCLPKGAECDLIEPDENYTFRLRCKARCISLWGYAFAPDTGFKSNYPTQTFAHGEVIQISEGELKLNPNFKTTEQQNLEEAVKCVCNINEDFCNLLDDYGIDSKKFVRLKNESFESARSFLLRSVANTGLEIISNRDLFLRVGRLMEWWDLPTSARELPDRILQRRIKETRGQSYTQVDSDYWARVEFYRKKEQSDKPLTSDAFLNELIEKLEDVSKTT